MNSRRIVLVILLVVGLGTLYGAYHTFVAQPTVVARVATFTTPDVAAAAPAANSVAVTSRISDAPDVVVQTTVVPADTVATSSIHLPDALEGLDSTEYRIAMMLCLDLY